MAPFDPYHKWLGIPKEEQPPNHYRLLGIRLFEDDPDVIEHAADQRMSHLRTLQTGQQGLQAQQLLNEISAARYCLLEEDKHEQYDQTLRAHSSPEPPHESETAEPDRESTDPAQDDTEELPRIQVTPKEKMAKEQQGLIPTAVDFLESVGRAVHDVIDGIKDHPAFYEKSQQAEPVVTPPLPPEPQATKTTKQVSGTRQPARTSKTVQAKKSPKKKSTAKKSPQTKSPAAEPTIATEKLPKLNSAEEYFKRGGVSYVLGKYDRAIADFTEAIRTNPKYAEAYEKRGYAWQKKNNRDQAMADLEKAYELYQERE